MADQKHICDRCGTHSIEDQQRSGYTGRLTAFDYSKNKELCSVISKLQCSLNKLQNDQDQLRSQMQSAVVPPVKHEHRVPKMVEQQTQYSYRSGFTPRSLDQSSLALFQELNSQKLSKSASGFQYSKPNSDRSEIIVNTLQIDQAGAEEKQPWKDKSVSFVNVALESPKHSTFKKTPRAAKIERHLSEEKNVAVLTEDPPDEMQSSNARSVPRLNLRGKWSARSEPNGMKRPHKVIKHSFKVFPEQTSESALRMLQSCKVKSTKQTLKITDSALWIGDKCVPFSSIIQIRVGKTTKLLIQNSECTSHNSCYLSVCTAEAVYDLEEEDPGSRVQFLEDLFRRMKRSHNLDVPSIWKAFIVDHPQCHLALDIVPEMSH